MLHDTLVSRRNASPVDNSSASNTPSSRTSIVVFGAAGRMGQRISALAASDRAFDLRACVARDAPSRIGTVITLNDASGAPRAHTLHSAKSPEIKGFHADVVIDFSSD